MESTLFIKKLLTDKDLEQKLREHGPKTAISLEEIRRLGKIFNSSNYESLIEKLQKQSHQDYLVVNSGWRNEQKEPIMLAIKYHQFREEFELSFIPTWSEIDEAANLLNTNLRNEIENRILHLSQPQSVTLIENILSHSTLYWIKNFKLSPKAHDDEGRDFTASISIKRDDSSIAFDGYGKMFECIGQLKHLKGKMIPGDMRDFIGAMETCRKKYGLVISTNGFTKRTLDAVKSSKFRIFCVDATFLANMILEHKIGLKKTKVKEGKIFDEDWWHEIDIFS